MLKAEENNSSSENFWMNGDYYCEGYEDLDKFSIDIDSLYEILSEESDPSLNLSLSQSNAKELSCKNSFQGETSSDEINHGSSQSQNEHEAPQVEDGLAGSSMHSCSEDLEVSDSRPGMGLECMLEFPGNSGMVFDHVHIDSHCHFDSPLRTCSVSLGDWSTSHVEHDTCSSRERDGGVMSAHLYNSEKTTKNQIPNCATTFKFAAGDEGLAVGGTDVNLMTENGYQLKDMGGDYHYKCGSDLTAFGDNGTRTGSSEDLQNLPTSDMDMILIDAETSLQNAHLPENNDNQASVASNQCSVESFSECFYSVVDSEKLANSSLEFLPYKFDMSFVESNEEKLSCMKGELEEQLRPSENICANSDNYYEVEAIAGMSVLPEKSPMSYTETKNSWDSFGRQATALSVSGQRLPSMFSFASSKIDLDSKVDIRGASKTLSSHSRNFGHEAVGSYYSAVSRSSACGAEHGPYVDHGSVHIVPDSPSLITNKRLKVCIKDEMKDTVVVPRSMGSHSSKFSGQAVVNNSSVCLSIDDDPDICILEDISDPRHPLPAVGHGNSLLISQHSASDPYLAGSGGARFTTNDERLTLRVALQDLSQPKSEATPPDGVLAVPLMRHQRIALSWMVQKETASLHCSGGILADDQGLGKTISTIALILKERAPSSKISSVTMKKDDTKTLNLDEDDDSGVHQLHGVKTEEYSGFKGLNMRTPKSENAFILNNKGRPAAGTLIVCPTSVLRQWAEELRNKVTKDADLNVLVYHGSNRTKDPFELTKYDVVLTTYSIVSMEVPKQPLVDKDDDEKVKPDGHGLQPMELSSCKKRKYPPSSGKKSRKDKKGTDGSLLESVARPLARVGWFRVVLDEAQSIKNHRTQVARACWGLRAKRRWCLSGTPIQNSIDDLYSYFRFLRYDPYAAYKSFCSMIKVPIARNGTNGYKKLQAVLKTIMLRRTKATRIDGEPIITLPPKSIELKKVDFSMEEREFYSKLEADSRAQFKVYAAAGTVQQNYVNILLMLLRLRQACDHPFLVKGCDSNSVWSSSLETVKKLPREEQKLLLSCLEASLAICGICTDSPEEAVVTVCGHVFCNQCISEHLTGDDNLCPEAQCKVHLNANSIFSGATLRRSMFDQSDHDDSASQLDEALDSSSDGSSDSSKIKAALKVLESLSKPRACISQVNSLKPCAEVERCPRDASNSHSVESLKDPLERKHIERETGLDDSSSIVSEKAIVFSQWTRMLDLLEARLKTSSIQYRRLDGTMSVIARDKAVKDFNTLPEVTVMIMSLKAASLGLNMVAACHVLLLDLWWNPTTEDQAIDRAHRIGQTRPVTVLRLTVKDTVEDRILALQQRKREMVASAFGEDETGSRQTRLTVDDLKYLFMA